MSRHKRSNSRNPSPALTARDCNRSRVHHGCRDVSHALTYFRRQIELGVGERDVATAHVQRLESEVTSLQSR